MWMFTSKDTADIGPFNMHRKFTSDQKLTEKFKSYFSVTYSLHM